MKYSTHDVAQIVTYVVVVAAVVVVVVLVVVVVIVLVLVCPGHYAGGDRQGHHRGSAIVI